MKTILTRYFLLFLFVLLLAFLASSDGQVSPFQGLGNAQFFDNNGQLLTAGVLYSYQAGSTTQQSTYTDSTGTVQNPNPIPFGSGARVSIWLSSGALYKFVLCLQNDGAFCLPSDVLFSVDQVPGAASGTGSGGGSSPFTGTFISGSANPASSGILRLASGDVVCWRNVAGSANLCLRKDTNDLLSWDGGSLKFPEIVAPACVSGFDQIWADSTAHRWKFCNNGSTPGNVVSSGVDINGSDQVTQLHFGASAVPLGTTGPNGIQTILWNGAQAVWYGAEQVLSGPWQAASSAAACSTTVTLGGIQGCMVYSFGGPHTLTRMTVQTNAAYGSCSTAPVVGVKDLTTGTVLLSLSPSTIGYSTTTAAITIPAFDLIGVGLLTAEVGCASIPNYTVTAIYQ